MKDYVKDVIKKYRTNNPFELAKSLDIKVIYLPLAHCNGYSTIISRGKFVCINNTLSNQQSALTLAHEIGHILLHKGYSTPQIRAHTNLLINKYEREANEFAIHLLINDDELREYRECYGYTTQQLAMIYGYPEELIKLRLK